MPNKAGATPAVALGDVVVAFRLAGGGIYHRGRARDACASPTANSSPSSGRPAAASRRLLNIAAGLLAPAAGRVDIFGAPLAALNRQAGYLFQADALFPWKTALENVAIGLETAGTPRERGAPARAGRG